MGLTINYDITANKILESTDAAVAVEKMRQKALDLPFEEVSGVIHLKGRKQCNFKTYQRDKNKEDEFMSCIMAASSVDISEHSSVSVCAKELFCFHINVGAGSEWATIGLATYPKTVTYVDSFKRKRKIHTKMSQWSMGSFCKTQYANNPDCGGLRNFIRCHVSLIMLLEQISEIPEVDVVINDEGQFGTSYYSDDYQEAYAKGQQPTYVWHDATHDLEVLIKQIGEYDQWVAAFAGSLSEVLEDTDKNLTLEAPIKDRTDFEYLEFLGNQSQSSQQLDNLNRLIRETVIKESKS